MSTVLTLPHGSGAPLHEWVNAHEPGDEMIYKEEFWQQIMFVRDVINFLFRTCYEDYKANPVRVVNTHTSKSIKLPVFSIAVTDRVNVLLRYNFHNWIVSVVSTSPVPDNFFGLFDREEEQECVYCEGFAAKWVFPPYASSPERFTLSLGNNYSLYTFCYLLAEGLGLGGNNQG
jgi:hypothetical protein